MDEIQGADERIVAEMSSLDAAGGLRRGGPRPFKWTLPKDRAAQLLAVGESQQKTADAVGVAERTVQRWLEHPDFAAEVDRLTMLSSVALRANRMRIVMQIIRQKVREDGTLLTEKDLLDWLKFAQSETDGAKLDLTSLLAASE